MSPLLAGMDVSFNSPPLFDSPVALSTLSTATEDDYLGANRHLVPAVPISSVSENMLSCLDISLCSSTLN